MTENEVTENFSHVLEQVKAGEKVGIADSKSEIVAWLVPKEKEAKPKRILGILEGKCTVTFRDDFKMTTEEFLGL